MQHGKKYRESIKLLGEKKEYGLTEAIELLKKVNYASFDATIELHLRLGIDPKKSEQQVRGIAFLPGGTGKTVKVLVLAQGDAEAAAQQAGADYVGLDAYIDKIEKGWTDFNIVIATPDVMSKVGKLGKALGPKGLMPSPKAGTITFDITKAVNDAKSGRVEFKADKNALIHTIAGKVSFSPEIIQKNIIAVIDAIKAAKPPEMKGTYIKNIVLSSTMSPGIPLNISLH